MSYSQTSSSNTDNLDPDYEESKAIGTTEAAITDSAVAARPQSDASARLVELLRRFGNVRLQLSCDLGQTTMKLKSLLALQHGNVVAVERPVGEDLGLRLNGVFFGRVDVMIVDSRVLLRVTEIGSED